MIKRLAILAVVAAALLGVLLYSQLRSQAIVISGTIEADEIRLGSLVGGRVKEVRAVEGQQTSVGKVLVELDPYDLVQREAEAAAQLAAAEAEQTRLQAGFRKEEIAQALAQRDQLKSHLELLEAGPRPQEIVAARARLDAAQADFKLAQDTFTRTRTLFQQNASTQERLDQATEQLDAASAMQIVRQQELGLLEEGTRKEEVAEARARLAEAQATLDLRQTGYRPEEIAVAQATTNAARSALEVIRRQVQELSIRSTVDGYIDSLDLRPGDLVSPRAPVLALLDRKHLWLRTYVPLNRRDVQLGDKVSIRIDGIADREFPGEITFVSRQAEFTPSNAQTPEDRQKQVFRVKVTLTGDTSRVRPGMTGEIELPPP